MRDAMSGMRVILILAGLAGSVLAQGRIPPRVASAQTTREATYLRLFREIDKLEAKAATPGLSVAQQAQLRGYHQKWLGLSPARAAQLRQAAVECMRDLRSEGMVAASGAGRPARPAPEAVSRGMDRVAAAVESLAKAMGRAEFAGFDATVRQYVLSPTIARPPAGQTHAMEESDPDPCIDDVTSITVDGTAYNSPPSGLTFQAGSQNTITFSGVGLVAAVLETIAGTCDPGDYSAAWTESQDGTTVSGNLTVGTSFSAACTIVLGLPAFQVAATLSPPPTISLTYNGSTIQQGSTVNITAAPSLPLVATLVPASGTSLSGTVSWTMQISYTGPGQYVYGLDIFTSPAAATSSWNIGSTMGGQFAGGSAVVSTSYGTVPLSFSFTILGTNPSANTVKAAVGTSPWYLQQLANYESGGYRQFDSSGYPLFGPPNGFGVMMVDYASNVYDLWTWTTNVSDGQANDAGNSTPAINAWGNQVRAWQAYNQSHTPVAMYADLTYGFDPCSFSATPTGGQHPFSDGIQIKFYNAGPNGTAFITFNANGAWAINDSNFYVSRVCSTNP